MWRKAPEAKPSSQSYNPPVSVPVASEESNPKPAARAPLQAPAASSAPASDLAAASAGRSASRITAGLKIHGEFSGTSDLYIDGEVQGKIRLGSARVTVGPNGRVQADIDAREIVIDGSVQGNLKASEAAHFGRSSRVVGTVVTPRIGIDDGARLRGKVETVRTAPTRESSTSVSEQDSEVLQPVAASTKGE
jgi:cytoskeletal protein CcmA (bactofilin family)